MPRYNLSALTSLSGIVINGANQTTLQIDPATWGNSVTPPVGPATFELDSGTIDSVVEGAGRFSTVTVTGGNQPGAHEVLTHRLHSGDWVVLVRQGTSGNRINGFTADGDGLKIRRSNPDTIWNRANIRRESDVLFVDQCVFFEVEGLTDKEAAYCLIDWDFDESGTFTHLTSRFPYEDQHARDLGFNSGMAWRTAGAKNVTVQITAFVNGALEAQTLSMAVNVPTKESYFPDATHRWIVDPSGNFTGAPAGVPAARRVTSFAAARAAAEAQVDKARISLPSDGDIADFDEISGRNIDHALIDVWGGNLPCRIDADTATGMTLNRFPFVYVETDLEFVGSYDPRTGVGDTPSRKIISEFDGHRYSMVRCEVSGCESGMALVGPNGGHGAFDCIFPKHEDYAIFVADSEALVFRGLVVEQSLSAVNKDDVKVHADGVTNFSDHLFRISNVQNACVSQMQVRTTSGWSQEFDPDSPAGYAPVRSHQGFRIVSSISNHQSRIKVNNIASEGAELIVEASGGGAERDTNHFIVVSNSYFMSTANAGGKIRIGHTGVFFVNLTFNTADVLRESGNPIDQVAVPQGSNLIPGDGWFDGEITFRNCTFLQMVSAANTRATATFDRTYRFDYIPDLGGPVVNHANCVFHVPNNTLDGDTEPRDEDVSSETNSFTPTYQGQRRARDDGALFDDAIDMFTQFASPAGSNFTGRLNPTSPKSLSLQLSADMPVYDHNGVVRGLTTSHGAYDQPAS